MPAPDDAAAPKWTPGPWRIDAPHGYAHDIVSVQDGYMICSFGAAEYSDDTNDANARLIAAAPTQDAALNYVADMTYCGVEGLWHFKQGYDPQIVLDALALARGESNAV